MHPRFSTTQDAYAMRKPLDEYFLEFGWEPPVQKIYKPLE
jgi:hypothetical protein